MGRYRGGSKPWEDDEEDGKRLGPRQFPELNAVFYKPVGSFVERRAKAAERQRKDHVNWREHTDATTSGHDRRQERHVTRTSTLDYGMQR